MLESYCRSGFGDCDGGKISAEVRQLGYGSQQGALVGGRQGALVGGWLGFGVLRPLAGLRGSFRVGFDVLWRLAGLCRSAVGRDLACFGGWQGCIS